jgi:hypothetical protein
MTNNVIKSDILSDLDQAQRLLERVYGYAQDIKNSNVEQLMSVADSCIIDAIEVLDNLGSV